MRTSRIKLNSVLDENTINVKHSQKTMEAEGSNFDPAEALKINLDQDSNTENFATTQPPYSSQNVIEVKEPINTLALHINNKL